MRFTGVRRELLDRLPRAGREDVLVRRQHLLRVRGRNVAWLPPLLLLVGVSAADFNTSGRFRLVSWVALAPAIAAAICPVWTTVAFSLLALGTYAAVDTAWPHQYRTGVPDFILVAASGVLSTLACEVRVQGELRLLHMQDIADTTRRTLLRPLPPLWGGLDHAAVYLAADTEARVGGDFYDIQPGPYGTRVLVGDVQGKGLGAVEAAAALLGTFREAAYHEPDLATIADRLEIRLLRHRVHTTALNREDGDRFATAVLLGYPAHDRAVVEVVNFGHEPPLVAGPHGVRRLAVGHRLPIGLGELDPGDGPAAVQRVPLAPGETVLLTTDGVTEARDADGRFYPLAEELSRALAADPCVAEPRRLAEFVRDGTLRHCRGRPADDTTILAVRLAAG